MNAPAYDATVRLLRNPHVTDADPEGPVSPPPPGALGSPAELHRLIDGYAPTELVDVAGLAATTGVARVLVKYEEERFGLPAFKILGASWACYRVLAQRHVDMVGTPPPAGSFEELRAALGGLGDVTLVTATDGNHGRAVARAARWFGAAADIYVPAGTAAARIAAIESEGATVTELDGDYDDAVAHAASTASADRLVVSDTSWPGYTEVPRWIAQGYGTLFSELDDQLAALGVGIPDAVIIPVGVGAFMLAALEHYPVGPPDGPLRISVEPLSADCLYQSLAAGEPVTVPGPHDSMMAGMNCGTVSLVAWPTMLARTDWAVAIDDADAGAAMRALAQAGIVAGETGAGTVGALLALACEPDGLVRLGLGPSSTVVCICTEAATDPVNYEAVVGRSPEAVRA